MAFELESAFDLLKSARLVEANLPDFDVGREAGAAEKSATRRHSRIVVVHLSRVHRAQHVALQVPYHNCGVSTACHYEFGVARNADANYFGLVFLKLFSIDQIKLYIIFYITK